MKNDFDIYFFRDLYVTFKNLFTRFLNWILGITNDETE